MPSFCLDAEEFAGIPKARQNHVLITPLHIETKGFPFHPDARDVGSNVSDNAFDLT